MSSSTDLSIAKSFLKQTKKQRLSAKSKKASSKTKSKNFKDREVNYTDLFDIKEPVYEQKIVFDEFTDIITVSEHRALVSCIQRSSYSPRKVFDSVNEERAMAGKSQFSDLVFDNLVYVDRSRSNLRKLKNDSKSKSIKKKKEKMKKYKVSEMRTHEKKIKSREDTTLDTPYDWSHILKLAQSEGIYDPQFCYKSSKANKLAYKLECYRIMKKTLTKRNKKNKKAAQKALKTPTLRESRRVREEKRAQARLVVRKARKARRDAKKSNKALPTESSFHCNDDEKEPEDTIFFDAIGHIKEAMKELTSLMDSCGISLDHLHLSTLIADVFSLVRLLYTADTWADVVAAVNLFLGSMNLRSSVLNGADSIAEFFRDFFCNKTKKMTEAWSDGLISVKNMMHVIVNTSLVKSLLKFFSAVYSLEFLGHLFPEQFVKYLPNVEPSSTLYDVFLIILDTIIVITRIAERIWEGQPISEAIFSDDPYAQFFRKSQHLQRIQNDLYTGTIIPGKYSYSEWKNEIGENIALGVVLIKSNFGKARTALRGEIKLLERIQLKMASWCHATRTMPFGIVLHGKPGQGKSYVIKHLARLVHKVTRVGDFFEDIIYSKNPIDDFWDGYDPAKSSIIHIPEMANQPLNVVKSRGDPMMQEVNRIMDRARYPLNMAFEDKGKILARPDLVVLETNNKEMNLEYAVGNPNAIRRRFVWIEVTCKPEFRIDGGQVCDTHKVKMFADDPMDIYDYDVMHYTFAGETKTEHHIRISNLYDFNEWFITTFTDHVEKEKMALFSNKVGSLYTRTEIETSLEEEKFISSEAGMVDDIKERVYQNCVGFYGAYNDNIGPYRLWHQVTVEDTRQVLQAYGQYVIGKNLAIVMSLPHKEYWAYFYVLLLSFMVSIFTMGFGNALLSLVSILLSSIMCFMIMSDHIAKRVKGIARARLEARKRYLKNNFLSGMKHLGFQTALISVGALSVLYMVRSIIKTVSLSSKNTEASQFHMDDDLVQFERMNHAGKGYKRVKTKLHPYYDNHVHRVFTPPKHKGNFSELSSAVSKNIRFVILKKENITRKSHIFGLRGNIAVVNTHFILNSLGETLAVRTTAGGRGDAYITFKIDNFNVVHLRNDISLIRVPGVQFRNILSHLVDSANLEGKYKAFIEGVGTRCVVEQKLELVDKFNGSSTVNVGFSYNYEMHEPGKCGIPLLIMRGNGVNVAGVHCAGNGGLGYATLLSSDIRKHVDEFEQQLGLMPLHSECHSEFVMEDPLPKSMFNYIPTRAIEYLGKMPGPVMMNKKSSLRPSVYRDGNFLDDLFFDTLGHVRENVFVPPMMAPRTVKGEYISPWNNALVKMDNIPPSLDISIMNVVIDRFTKHIIDNVKCPDLNPLDFEAAINGITHDPFTRRINASTAGGYGFEGVKSKYLPIYEGDVRSMSPELEKALVYNIKCLENGMTPLFVNTACLKEEPRLLSKALQGKTRVFSSTGLDKLCLERAMLSPFYTLMVEQPDVFCTAVGIDMHKGAHKVIDAISTFSDDVSNAYIMEFDYSAYDQTMPPDVGHGVSTIVCNVLRHFGYSERNLQIVRGLLTSNIYVHMSMNKDLFMKAGLQPSGKYATAEDNSLRGMFLLMYAWYASPNSDKDFFDYIRPVTYGDDALVAVHPIVVDSFNNLTYRDACKKHFGMTITSALKSGQLNAFMPFERVSFLKRRFKWSDQFQSWSGILDLDSCYKALEWRLPSKYVTEEEQVISCSTAVLWEVFIHCRDDAVNFNGFRDRLVDKLVECYGVDDSCLPSFSEIADKLY